MTGRIYRYEVPVDDQAHAFELHGDPLAVGSRRPDVVEFWAIHHDEGAVAVVRRFLAVGTGHPLPSDLAVTRWHWGAVYAADGQLVWHLVEVW